MIVLLFYISIISIIIIYVVASENLYEDNHSSSKNKNVKHLEINTQSFFPKYDPEEYKRQKLLRNHKAFKGCEFWDGMNIDFSFNIELLHNKMCPYCSSELPNRKGKSYKCPSCGGKVYRLKDLISDFEGLFTQEQKETREQLKKELSRRKRFLEIYQNAKNYIDFKPTKFKNDNIVILVGLLNESKKYISKPSSVNKLRMCRFYEGELCFNIEGYEKLGLNAFLAVSYIDLWGSYNSLFCDEDFTKEELLEDGFTEFRDDNRIAPYILEKIKSFDCNIERLKGLFLVCAKMVEKSVKYNPPITLEEAWEKFYEQYLQG